MAARTPRPEDVALSLTLAVVVASPGPLLLLDGDLAVIATSESFCDLFGFSPDELKGRQVHAIGDGEWDGPQLRAAMAEAVAGEGRSEACEIDLKQAGAPVRRLIVQATRVTYLDLDHLRILLAVSDVTGARADAALTAHAQRQNEVLLQEVRHRVANSLQIIASVLLQNARRTRSEETRGHLKDAHHRVMSVAGLERMLSTSEEGEVEVQTYFTRLCATITASLIGEVDRISLTVEGGQGVVEASVSVSLGLIVTELVINALKYAFPGDRPGRITIDYDFHGPNWVLCVRDDGVGMPAAGEPFRAGLGSSIVQALAGQLHARVEVSAESPGTKVSIEHIQIAMVEDQPDTAGKPIATAAHASRATRS